MSCDRGRAKLCSNSYMPLANTRCFQPGKKTLMAHLEQNEQTEYRARASMSVHSSTTNSPQLNLDVLFEVMRQIEQSGTLLQMMYTCRTLYEGGVPLLLASHITIDVGTDLERFRSFCRYVMEDVSRCRHMRALTINRSDPVRCWMTTGKWTAFEKEALLALAYNVSDLENLDIAYPSFFVDYRCSEAFQSLSNLKQLRIRNYCTISEQFLSLLKSPLRHLDVGFLGREDFIAIIRPHKEFLETLRVSCCKPPDIQEPLTVFSNVTSLHLTDAMVRNTDGPFLMQSFPSLRELNVNNDTLTQSEQSPSEFRNLTDIRHASIAEQQRSGCGWPALEKLAGDIFWVYCLGATCPVRELRFENQLRTKVDMHLACCMVLLELARPKQLYCSMDAYTQCKYYAYQILEVVGPTVQKLELKIEDTDQRELREVLSNCPYHRLHALNRYPYPLNGSTNRTRPTRGYSST
ncbi:hypothetical protein BDW22DRAFT_988426 [Trametopsis cervina]|nr:hypothetical protein BDW22DRAFT_988426 [Trametopsis cervina]